MALGWHEVGEAIWAINLSTSKETHTEVLQQIFRFSDEVKRQLGQVATYLKSNKLGQLETQVNTTVAASVEELKAETDLLYYKSNVKRQKRMNPLDRKSLLNCKISWRTNARRS